jgi:glycosyltransferase involved in cell wall biosynthesis
LIPKITVWTPVFNGEKFLERSILSVVEQTQTPFEYIIVDDGSTDSSFQIAESYSQKYDWITVYKNTQNIGIFETSRKVSNLARGNFLYCVADDDFSASIAIERFSASIKRWPNAQLFSGQIQVIDSEEKKVCVEKVSNWNTIDFHNPRDCLTNYFLKEPAHHSLSAASLISSKVFRHLGGFNEDLGHWSDTFNLRYIAFDNGMVYIPEVLHYWTSNHNTLSGCERNNPKEFLKVIHNSAKLMRSDRYKLVFPEEFVQYWEDGCCHYIIDPILGSYEYLLLQRNLRFFNAIKDDNLKNKLIGFLFKYFLIIENIIFTKVIKNKTQSLWSYFTILKHNNSAHKKT